MSINPALTQQMCAMGGPSVSHAGAGPLNINHGTGWQKNYSQSGGSGNQQFNIDTINYTQHQASLERRETPPIPESTVPFLPDPHFVEREELAELKQTLSSIRRRVALVGLGGIGYLPRKMKARLYTVTDGRGRKSQLAIEYCHRMREESPETWVLWLHTSSAARFEASIQKLANDVKIAGRKDPQADIYQLTYDWLRDARKGRWVIVLDNADDAEFLLQAPSLNVEGRNKGNRTLARRARIDYLPICQHGSVLITSRYLAMAEKLVDRCDIITVHSMTKEHAVMLLERKVGQTRSIGLEKLAAALEHIPLAIAQASAYIKRRGSTCSVEQYLIMFEESVRSRISLLNVDSIELRRDREAANSILVTWQISFEHISKSTPSAAELLSLMSFFDYQDVPEYLLQAAGDDNSLANRWTSQEFEEDILTLRDYYFISIASSGTSFAMHRLVQVAAWKWLESQGHYQQWAYQSFQKLDAVLPNGDDYANWDRCRELSSHARLALEVRVEERQTRILRASILYKAAWFASVQRRAAEAQILAEACVQERTSMVGGESEETSSGEAILALVLQDQGKYEVAEEITRRVLVKRERLLGREHPYTLTSADHLASALQYQGMYKAAEGISQRVLAGREKVLGADHPDTLASVNNLAFVLQQQGKYEAAEKMNRRALLGNEQALGAEHPNTLTIVSNLALVLRYQGKYESAEEMDRRTLAGRERALGAEHPDTLTSADNLALVLYCQGRYAAAEETSRRALAGRKQALGAEHPETLTSVSNLAGMLQVQGKYEAAEKMSRRAVAGYEQALGAEHPYTLTSINNLASVLHLQGKYAAAEKTSRQALVGREQALGVEHPDTLSSLSNLAGMLRDQGKYEAAEEMNWQALAGRGQALGLEHPDTLRSVSNLASVLQYQGKYEAAEELSRQALVGREKALGAEHPDTLRSVSHLALVLQCQGKYEAAEEIRQRRR